MNKKIMSTLTSVVIMANAFAIPFADAKQKVHINIPDLLFNEHFGVNGVAQYIENGNEKYVRLIEHKNGIEAGGVYLKNKIDLREDFAFYGKANFGIIDGQTPGDGMGFAFHPNNIDAVGSGGPNLGIVGLDYAVGFGLDTYDNWDGAVSQDGFNETIVPYGSFWETGTGTTFLNVKKTQTQKIVNSENKENFFNGKDKNIEFIYTANNKTLTINYRDDQGNTMQWTKDLTEYVNTISQLNPNNIPEVSFIVGASKGEAYNEHRIYFNNIRYSTYKYSSSYSFQKYDTTLNIDLPTTVTALLPAQRDNISTNETITPATIATKQVEDTVNKGYWIFSGWNQDSVTITQDDVEFIGKWKFFKNPTILTPVFDKSKLTEEEKTEVKKNITNSNPDLEILNIEVNNDGSTKIILRNNEEVLVPADKIITRTEESVKRKVVYQDHYGFYEGHERVIQEGEDGIIVNGKIIKQPVERIIERGTRPRNNNSNSGGGGTGAGGYTPSSDNGNANSNGNTNSNGNGGNVNTNNNSWLKPSITPATTRILDNTGNGVNQNNINNNTNNNPNTNNVGFIFDVEKDNFNNDKIILNPVTVISTDNNLNNENKNTNNNKDNKNSDNNKNNTTNTKDAKNDKISAMTMIKTGSSFMLIVLLSLMSGYIVLRKNKNKTHI